MINYVTHSLVRAALVVAFILLAIANNMFAQTNSQQHNNKIRIKISKDVNGKQTEIDTTFETEEAADIFISEFNTEVDNDDTNIEMHINDEDLSKQSFGFYLNEDSTASNNNMFNLGFSAPGWSQDDREKFNAELKKLHEELKNELGDFNFKMDTASAQNNFNYNFNFRMPDDTEMEKLREDLRGFNLQMPTMPDVPNFDYQTEGLSKADQKKFDEAMQKAEAEYNKAMELLKKNDGKIIMPSMPPCGSSFNFNSEDDKTSNTNQKRVVIIQRSRSKETKKEAKPKSILEEGKSKDFEINDFNYYPNPNNGKFDVSFSLPNKGDLKITITDSDGRTFYDETLQNFSGQYEQSFNLSEEGAGVYFLKIIQGKGWMTKKVVVK
jgi:lipopolysaccharide export LptBFGC system permease protein LptF